MLQQVQQRRHRINSILVLHTRWQSVCVMNVPGVWWNTKLFLTGSAFVRCLA
jgi:hypothetical protein